MFQFSLSKLKYQSGLAHNINCIFILQQLTIPPLKSNLLTMELYLLFKLPGLNVASDLTLKNAESQACEYNKILYKFHVFRIQQQVVVALNFLTLGIKNLFWE